jgi:hypothetical protein
MADSDEMVRTLVRIRGCASEAEATSPTTANKILSPEFGCI